MPRPTHDELRAMLAAVRDGTLGYDGIYGALFQLGSAQVWDAVPNIEGFLDHEEADFRRLALQSLAYDFHLRRHWETARNMLQHDPDPYVRMTAAGVVASMGGESDRPAALRSLAGVVSNSREDSGVRGAAYTAMLRLLDPGGWPHFGFGGLPNLDTDVDWGLVNSHL